MMGSRSPHIDDKVFIVTGGAVGVGAAVVRSLLFENARYVAFLDIKKREGSTLETELIRKFGALRAKFIECDISDEEQLESAFQQVVDKYRRLDVVVNNAGILGEDELFQRMIDINFTATVRTTLKALDIMGAEKGGGGGTVVNVSSLLALKHHSHLPVYAATKTAVLQFSKTIGAEERYSKTKVRVVTVCLGPTDTAILQRQNLANFDKDSAKSLTSRVPVRQRWLGDGARWGHSFIPLLLPLGMALSACRSPPATAPIPMPPPPACLLKPQQQAIHAVESAANGIVEVINRGESGSTWMVANDEPAVDISESVKDGFDVMARVVPK